MKGVFKLENPDDLMASLTLTMTIEQWKRLNALLDSKYPGWQVKQLIERLVVKATVAFTEQDEYEP